MAIETGVGGVNVTDGRYVDHQRKSSRDARRFAEEQAVVVEVECRGCLLYTSPSPRDKRQSRMPSSA